jgi:drug/metabolite transporter (DMT)-like permease
LVGVATGVLGRARVAAVAPAAWWALAFLVLLGSVVGYSCYVWLLKVVRPEIVGTYTFVNPVVAVVLAFLWGDGAPTWLTIGAAALIVAGVAIVVTAPKPAPVNVQLDTSAASN